MDSLKKSIEDDNIYKKLIKLASLNYNNKDNSKDINKDNNKDINKDNNLIKKGGSKKEKPTIVKIFNIDDITKDLEENKNIFTDSDSEYIEIFSNNFNL